MKRCKGSREIGRFLDTLVRRGIRVEMTRNNQWKVFSPNGKDIVIVSYTASDRFALKNIKGDLRRAGIEV